MDQRSSPMGLYSFLGSSFGVLWSTRVCCPDPSQFARWNNVQKIKRLNWATRSTSLACSQVTLLMVLSRTLLLCRYLEGDALDSDDSDDDDQPDEFEGNATTKRTKATKANWPRCLPHFRTCSITAARTTPSSYAVPDQNVFLAEHTGMGARQFWAKWPDLPQRKQESLAPNSTFGLEAGITTHLDMGELCWELYGCWGRAESCEQGLAGFFDSNFSALLSFTARLMRFSSSESHARGSWR